MTVPLDGYESELHPPSPVKVTLSLAMKVNLGNYESAEAFLSITVGPETSQAEIDAVLEGPAKIAYDALRLRMAEKVAALRRKE